MQQKNHLRLILFRPCVLFTSSEKIYDRDLLLGVGILFHTFEEESGIVVKLKLLFLNDGFLDTVYIFKISC